MSILTKVCIVVLLVLILLACPVFITQATMAPNYRLAYDQERIRAELHAQSARQAHLALRRALEESKLSNTQATEELTRRQQKIDALQLDLTQQRQENVNLTGKIDKINMSLADLEKNYKATFERGELLAKDLDEARKEIAKLNDVYRRTDELLKQKQADVDRMDKVIKVLREELVNREDRIKELEEKVVALQMKGAAVAVGEGAEQAPALPATEVTGTITAIKDDMASINVGSAKGIAQGMKLIVYRGSSFVANLKIVEVDTNQAAGIIIDRKLDPMQGDKVTSAKWK